VYTSVRLLVRRENASSAPVGSQFGSFVSPAVMMGVRVLPSGASRTMSPRNSSSMLSTAIVVPSGDHAGESHEQDRR
jgi:hypothetical protein